MEKLKINILEIKPFIMLSAFPKDFSKVASPICNFHSGNFPCVLAVALGSQPILADVPGPLANFSRSARSQLRSAAPQRA